MSHEVSPYVPRLTGLQGAGKQDRNCLKVWDIPSGLATAGSMGSDAIPHVVHDPEKCNSRQFGGCASRDLSLRGAPPLHALP
jgi:hypothetical protein